MLQGSSSGLHDCSWSFINAEKRSLHFSYFMFVVFLVVVFIFVVVVVVVVAVDVVVIVVVIFVDVVIAVALTVTVNFPSEIELLFFIPTKITFETTFGNTFE